MCNEEKVLLDLPEKLQNIHIECVSERHSLVKLFHFCFYCNILLMFLRLYFDKSLGHGLVEILVTFHLCQNQQVEF